jgi:hypothetical protein
MSQHRIFVYSGTIDNAFKEAAKKSLTDANWEPVWDLSDPFQILACTGADRSTCKPQTPNLYQYAIIARRS